MGRRNQVSIFFYLNEEGRRSNLLTGGNGKAEQWVMGFIDPVDLCLFQVRPDGVTVALLSELVPTRPRIAGSGIRWTDDPFSAGTTQ